MVRHGRSLPLLVVVAVASLVLGSFGTAVAGPALTKGQVKKIAANVVENAAPDLSVAKAKTATDAAKLDGAAPAAYLTKSYRYRLPVQAPATSRFYAFPGMTGGTYLFTYDVIMSGAAPGTYCDMVPAQSPQNGEGYSNATPTTGFGRLHGSGIIQFTGNTVRLQCGGSTFTIYTGTETLSSVTFTKVDDLTTGTATSP
jgi:hypothetical protein